MQESSVASMFDRLPDKVRKIAFEIAVKQMLAATMAKSVEDAFAAHKKISSELQSLVESIQNLKDEIRFACEAHVKTLTNGK